MFYMNEISFKKKEKIFWKKIKYINLFKTVIKQSLLRGKIIVFNKNLLELLIIKIIKINYFKIY